MCISFVVDDDSLSLYTPSTRAAFVLSFGIRVEFTELMQMSIVFSMVLIICLKVLSIFLFVIIDILFKEQLF